MYAAGVKLLSSNDKASSTCKNVGRSCVYSRIFMIVPQIFAGCLSWQVKPPTNKWKTKWMFLLFYERNFIEEINIGLIASAIIDLVPRQR